MVISPFFSQFSLLKPSSHILPELWTEKETGEAAEEAPFLSLLAWHANSIASAQKASQSALTQHTLLTVRLLHNFSFNFNISCVRVSLRCCYLLESRVRVWGHWEVFLVCKLSECIRSKEWRVGGVCYVYIVCIWLIRGNRIDWLAGRWLVAHLDTYVCG